MFLKYFQVVNDGPINRLSLDFKVNSSGRPLPLVLTGINGSGKTNILSVLADALFECAATGYNDVLPQVGMGRSWFRIVGGRTISFGAEGSYAIAEFSHDGEVIVFQQRAGLYDVDLARSEVPEHLAERLGWKTGDSQSYKSISVSADGSKQIFSTGAYNFFPASRAEVPHWFNTKANLEILDGLSGRIEGELGRSILVGSGIPVLSPWITGLISDNRVGYVWANDPQTDQRMVRILGDDLVRAEQSEATLSSLNKILQIVLNDPVAHFVSVSRHLQPAVYIQRSSGSQTTISSLSSAQATLLALFASILRQGDMAGLGSNVGGICLVDEIDAHLHIDLQAKALPNLIKMFPSVQFIVSAHSPIFVLGMSRAFGSDVTFVDVANAAELPAESYSEMAELMTVVESTQKFEQHVLRKAKDDSERVLVLTEGETDPEYLRTAASLLNRTASLEHAEFDWVGAVGPNGSVGSGKTALDHAWTFLCCNPNLINRPVLLLYDVDTNKPTQRANKVATLTLPPNPANTRIVGGIENLLSENAIGEELYQTSQSAKNDGGFHVEKRLKKVEACKVICERSSLEDFTAFDAALALVEEVIMDLRSRLDSR